MQLKGKKTPYVILAPFVEPTLKKIRQSLEISEGVEQELLDNFTKYVEAPLRELARRQKEDMYGTKHVD